MLNAMQQQAVNAGGGHYLVLAGAGSGKTTVLTERALRLIQDGTARPSEVLSITFTNKAAKEMKERIEAQADGLDLRDMWTCTFHSMCARILRMYPRASGFPLSFSIYDADDSKSLVNAALKELRMEGWYKPSDVKTWISRYKNSRDALLQVILGDPEDAKTLSQFYERKDLRTFGQWCSLTNRDGDKEALDRIWERYQGMLMQEAAMDFDDLLLNTLKVLRRDAAALHSLRSRFRWIMVDEYQDTNPVQYELLRILAAGSDNLFCVGDDDQSIYSFRGTDIGIIRRFQDDYQDAEVIRLEENYRSTASILEASNAVIARNRQRLGKTLWTQNATGPRPEIHFLADDREEADVITDDIMHRHAQEGEPFGANAVLYRMHSVSRTIEEALIDRGIPYRVYGGLGFYSRQEVKDILAYLSLLVNPKADQQLLRIVNVPKRGLGPATMAKLKREAGIHGIPVLEMMRQAGKHLPLTPAAQGRIAEFVKLYDSLARFAISHPEAGDIVREVCERTGYLDMLKQNEAENEDRIANLSELVNAASAFDQTGEGGLGAFMQRLSLLTDQDAAEDEDAVKLMTVHAAKGLEFDNVFVAGMSEGIFPSKRAVNEGNTEEERRLCYVAMTRARKRLTLLTGTWRQVFGKAMQCGPSRFLGEIPEHAAEIIGARQKKQSLPAQARAAAALRFGRAG